MVQLLWKTVWWFLKKLNIFLSCNPVDPWYLPEQVENLRLTEKSVHMSLQQHFFNCQSLGATKMSLSDEWIKYCISRQQITVLFSDKKK